MSRPPNIGKKFSATDLKPSVGQRLVESAKQCTPTHKMWIETGCLPQGVRIYQDGKVIEGRGEHEKAVCVSERFGEWEGKSCIAEKDPIRMSAPKGWSKVK